MKNFKVEKSHFSHIDGRQYAKSREPNLFWTWNFQGLFLALLSSISEVFKKFLSVVIFCQIKRCSKMHAFVFCGWTGFFSENPAVSHFLPFWCLTTCKVSEKSLEPFSQTFRGHTDGLFFDSYNPQLSSWGTVTC